MSHLLANIVSWVFQICILAMIARVIVSWVAQASRHPAVMLLCRYTDPALEPIRRRLQPYTGQIDFSPMVVILVLIVLRDLIIRVLLSSA